MERVNAVIEALEEEPAQGLVMLDTMLLLFVPHIKLPISSVTNAQVLQFIALQDDFQYNVALSLVRCYEKVGEIDGNYRDGDPDKGEDTSNGERETKDSVRPAILTINRLLQGLLLLHPKSRGLFRRGNNMRVILRLLDESTSAIMTISLITTLIHVLLKDLGNFRVFEREGGCASVIRKMKTASDDEDRVNYKVIEFLIFYLVDEGEGKNSRAIIEKLEYFREEFPDIDDLVGSLAELKGR